MKTYKYLIKNTFTFSIDEAAKIFYKDFQKFHELSWTNIYLSEDRIFWFGNVGPTYATNSWIDMYSILEKQDLYMWEAVRLYINSGKLWAPKKEKKCTCGALVCKTTHSLWCDIL